MNEINRISRIRPIKRMRKVTKNSSNNSKEKKKKKKKKRSQMPLIPKKKEKIKQNTKKEKINSEQIAVNILTFVKLMYEIYKEEHPGQSSERRSYNFYHLAHRAIDSGYKNIKSINNTLPLEIDQLITQTHNQAIKKLDEWLQIKEYDNKNKNISISDINSLQITNQIKNLVIKIFNKQIWAQNK